jgi:pantoate--beta-alanine ligase
MQVVDHIAPLKAAIRLLKSRGKSVGLVPTMGALHEGHLSLIRQSIAETGITVVSIFVNPTQFNDKKDLEKYPGNIRKDLDSLRELLRAADLVFTPDVPEIYPEEDIRVFDFGHLDKIMEGAFRKGHFNGVAQVVTKLFDIVTPDRAYFGEKDYQQLVIINHLVKQQSYPVVIVPCPIIREADGLALSSRNQRLSDQERIEAALIPKTLFQAARKATHLEVDEVKKWVVETLNSSKLLQVEYFEIVDGSQLEPVKNWSEKGKIIGCVAVWAGQIRLIDNITFRE